LLELVFLQFVNGIISGSSYALVAVGQTMIWGVLRALNFAHGEYYMLGAMGGWLIMSLAPLPYGAVIPLSLILSLMIAVGISRSVMEHLIDVPVEMAVLASLGTSLVLQNGVMLLVPGTYRTFEGGWLRSISFLGSRMAEQRVVVFVATLIIFFLLEALIRRTRIGKAMRAVAQNKECCVVVGIDMAAVARFTYVLGIGLAALAGILMAPIVTVITPTMGIGITLKAFVVIVIGGIGNVRGTFLAAHFLGVVESLVVGFIGMQMRESVGYLALVAVLLWRPQGLFSLKGRY
jgi:branched-chain amino acid transport system permease protein